MLLCNLWGGEDESGVEQSGNSHGNLNTRKSFETAFSILKMKMKTDDDDFGHNLYNTKL